MTISLRYSPGIHCIVGFLCLIALASCAAESNDTSNTEYELLYDLYFGDPSNLSDAAIELEQHLHKNTQDEIARCMAESGFEYIPEVLPNQHSSNEIRSEEGAAIPGFGISFGPDVFNDDSTHRSTTIQTSEYLDSLYRKDGCYDQARATERSFNSILQDYTEEFGDMWEGYVSHPVVIEANDRWVQCMKQAGFMFHNLEKLQSEIVKMFEEAQTSSDIRSVQQYEVAAAASHADCNKGLPEMYDSVISQMSREFNNKYRAEILVKIEHVS